MGIIPEKTDYYRERQEALRRSRGKRGDYWLSQYTELRKKNSHKQTVDIMVKPYKGQRKEIAKELEYTGALWNDNRTPDTSGRK